MELNGLPKLFGESTTGKIKEWQATVEVHSTLQGPATIVIHSGYVGQKIQAKKKVIKKGKNIGKANETTPFEQAFSQIESAWNKKRHNNYEPDLMLFDPIDTGTPGSCVIGPGYKPRYMLPQLAKGMGKGNIKYPCAIQPKLNGICNLSEIRSDDVLNHSRGGHFFDTLDHLNEWILALDAPAPIHGELYVHGWSLQKIGSYTKKVKPDQHKLQLWIYDMAHLTWNFAERWAWLEKNLGKLIKDNLDCPLVLTPTKIANNYDEVIAFHDEQVQNGFEGAMKKNLKGKYVLQFRSNDLEKEKRYHTAEFEIVGGKEGVGTDEGCVVYTCVTEDGQEFEARPRGTVEDRKAMFQNLENDIGKMLTVRYAELSDKGIPLQPVGIPAEAEAIRDYE